MVFSFVYLLVLNFLVVLFGIEFCSGLFPRFWRVRSLRVLLCLRFICSLIGFFCFSVVVSIGYFDLSVVVVFIGFPCVWLFCFLWFCGSLACDFVSGQVAISVLSSRSSCAYFVFCYGMLLWCACFFLVCFLLVFFSLLLPSVPCLACVVIDFWGSPFVFFDLTFGWTFGGLSCGRFLDFACVLFLCFCYFWLFYVRVRW